MKVSCANELVITKRTSRVIAFPQIREHAKVRNIYGLNKNWNCRQKVSQGRLHLHRLMIRDLFIKSETDLCNLSFSVGKLIIEKPKRWMSEMQMSESWEFQSLRQEKCWRICITRQQKVSSGTETETGRIFTGNSICCWCSNQGKKTHMYTYIITYWPAGGGRGQNPENTAQGHSGHNSIPP